ncbi:hypothetical protein TWF481_000037 [Arthrobotrys musiformis]|uniref:C2H2-type domain-containing protein n=1 Tax=Arthrobotrys musiformis TaxID=47236 RepID=A0AAV9WNK1_9PEZI
MVWKGEGKVPTAVSLPWDFCKRFTAEEVAWLLKDGYSYEPHADETLLFFRADDRGRWQKVSQRELQRELRRQGIRQGDTWVPRYMYELKRYGRMLLQPERDRALWWGDLHRWPIGPVSQGVLNEAKEILKGSGEKRGETGKRKRETTREGNPESEYRSAAPGLKRRRVAYRAASRSVQPDESENVAMTDVREEFVAPISDPMPESATDRLIPDEAALEGPKEGFKPLAEAPERRRRARKAAIDPAPATETSKAGAQAPAQVEIAVAGRLERCGWRETDGSVCGGVFSTKLELQNHVLNSHVPKRGDLPEGQTNWLCHFGRCAHSNVGTDRPSLSGIFGKADSMSSHIRFLLDAREFECRFSAAGCRKRWNRLNDMNTHAKKCKFNPSPKTKETQSAKGEEGQEGR